MPLKGGVVYGAICVYHFNFDFRNRLHIDSKKRNNRPSAQTLAVISYKPTIFGANRLLVTPCTYIILKIEKKSTENTEIYVKIKKNNYTSGE